MAWVAPILSVFFLFSCVDSEEGISREEANAQFKQAISQANSCTTDEDCVVVYPGCPLGCSVSVNPDRQQAIKSLAKELVQSFEQREGRCDYFCEAQYPVCVIDRCEVRDL